MKKKYQNFDTFLKISDFERINTRKKVFKMLIESQGKLGKSQGKVREKSGNSVSNMGEGLIPLMWGYRLVWRCTPPSDTFKFLLLLMI